MGNDIQQEIDLINNLVQQAVCHGADPGGSYSQNRENLISAINKWLEYRNLTGDYMIIDTEDYSMWCRLAIVRRNEKDGNYGNEAV